MRDGEVCGVCFNELNHVISFNKQLAKLNCYRFSDPNGFSRFCPTDRPTIQYRTRYYELYN